MPPIALQAQPEHAFTAYSAGLVVTIAAELHDPCGWGTKSTGELWGFRIQRQLTGPKSANLQSQHNMLWVRIDMPHAERYFHDCAAETDTVCTGSLGAWWMA